jgi:hypothetical protein
VLQIAQSQQTWGATMELAVGTPTQKGEESQRRLLTPQDLLATCYKFPGVSAVTEFRESRRASLLLPHGELIRP